MTAIGAQLLNIENPGMKTYGVAGTAQGLAQGYSQKASLDTMAMQSQMEADIAKQDAEEVARLGEQQIADFTERVRLAASASTAAIAQKNIELGSGLSQAIQRDNARAASMDILAIQNNIANKVLSLDFKAARAEAQASVYERAGKDALIAGVLTGVSSGIAKGHEAEQDRKNISKESKVDVRARTISAWRR